MRQQEYLDRNAKGYEGDNLIHEEIKMLCEYHEVDTIIETGTYRGGTTKRLSEIGLPVHSFELVKESFDYALEFCAGKKNVAIYNSDSVEGLKKLLPTLKEASLFLFLDAHWERHCPLLEELKVIADNGFQPVIAIHDFKVPGKDFGYDSYNGQDFTLEWITPSLNEIYPNGFNYHYNTEAEGAQRGVIYIYP